MTAAGCGEDDRLAGTQAFWDSLIGEEGEFAQQSEFGRGMWAAGRNWVTGAFPRPSCGCCRTWPGWTRSGSVLHEAGFTLEWLEELQAPVGASTPWPFVDAAWANRWPSVCVWVARKCTA